MRTKCPNCGAEGLLDTDLIEMWVKHEGTKYHFNLCCSCYDGDRLEEYARKHLVKIGIIKEE